MMWVFSFGGYMKKVLTFIIIVVMAVSLVGCVGGKDNSISYKQTAYLIGECDEFNLTVISGLRESPYVMDGERGDLVEFCTITLKPSSNDGVNVSYTYEVTVEGESYTGSLNKDTFGTTLSGDIGVDIGDSITNIVIKFGEETETVMLENMMANSLISSDDALSIAEDALQDTLSKLPEEDKREVYLKFVSDIVGEESVYYWYVAYVGEGGRYSAVLIDIVSGDIIAKRA